MKVFVAYTVEVDDDFRRAINMHYGKPGLAGREEVKRWFESFGHSMNDDLSMSLTDHDEQETDDDQTPA